MPFLKVVHKANPSPQKREHPTRAELKWFFLLSDQDLELVVVTHLIQPMLQDRSVSAVSDHPAGVVSSGLPKFTYVPVLTLFA